MWRSDTSILGFWEAIQYFYTNYLTFFASFLLLCYPFDLGPNVSKISVDGNLLCEIRAEDTSEADLLKTIYFLVWLCFPWRFSSSAFWMTVISSASTAELRYQSTFCVMTWSSSWHSFISRHMSFSGIPWLPTCVFAKHLAHRECCNVPDLLAEAGKQPYVKIQTVICWPYPMKVWWSRVPGLSSKNPKQHVVSWEGCTSVAWWTGQQELSETTGSLRTLGRQYCLDRSSSTCCPLPVSVKQSHVKDWEGFATVFCLGEATGQ